MNRKVVVNILGRILLVVSILMLLPFAMTFIYRESLTNILAFAIPILVIFTAGMIMTMRRVENYSLGIKDGLFVTSVSWLLMSLVGTVPFLISQEIPNFFDAFFEITSGFTTTGASILTPEQVAGLSKSLLFWRSFSHWIGGMGILVFVLAVAPKNNEYSMHILRAESPGPTVGKLVAKMSKSSQILYIIYVVLTLLLFGILMFIRGPEGKITWFEALCTAFGKAGTGGFVVTANGINDFYPAAQYVISVFMLIFGTNFSLFFLLIIRNFKQVVRNEEIRWYLATVVIATAIITLNTYSIYGNFEETFRTALFQTSSIISTTGFFTVDYASTWPALSLSIIIILMLTGSCAGSTAGGMKQSRIIILVKRGFVKIAKIFNPRSVHLVRVDGVPIDEKVGANIVDFAILYFLFLATCAFLTSIYNPNMIGLDPITSITASLSCISNVGPGLGLVGPAGNFAAYSGFSKIIFAIEMIAGRLELLPVLILFNPYTYKSKNSF